MVNLELDLIENGKLKFSQCQVSKEHTKRQSRFWIPMLVKCEQETPEHAHCLAVKLASSYFPSSGINFQPIVRHYKMQFTPQFCEAVQESDFCSFISCHSCLQSINMKTTRSRSQLVYFLLAILCLQFVVTIWVHFINCTGQSAERSGQCLFTKNATIPGKRKPMHWFRRLNW